jgi:subtilisin family serine protease
MFSNPVPLSTQLGKFFIEAPYQELVLTSISILNLKGSLMKNSFFRTVATCSLSLLIASCFSVDNQTVIPQKWQAYFNAKPQIKNPEITNKNHQILLAVIDTGVDYNQPYLQSKIHYTLDKNNNAIGAGWDFIGEDALPLPYLARTKYLYDRDEKTQTSEHESLLLIDLLIQSEPVLFKYLHPHRLHKMEKQIGIYHGTHVAGLASYDDNRIGIIPYRLMPSNENLDLSSKDTNEEFLIFLGKSIEDAAKRGVKVINLSLGLSFKKEKDGNGKMTKLFKNFETMVNNHPEIVFVAASGNEAAWHDGEQRFNFPCGINAQNMLCVSALNPKGQLASFTNIPLLDTPVVFASGVDIISTMPTDYCNSEGIEEANSYGKLSALDADEKTPPEKIAQLRADKAKELAARILSECKIVKKDGSKNAEADGVNYLDVSQTLVDKLSGTSMSSPVVARLMAQKILETKLTGSAAVQALLQSAEKVQKGPLTILKLKAPKPSWYNGQKNEFEALSASSGSGDDFEFFAPYTAK